MTHPKAYAFLQRTCKEGKNLVPQEIVDDWLAGGASTKTSSCGLSFGKSTLKVVARLTTAFVLKLMSRYGKQPGTGPPWLASPATLRSLDLMASSGIRHLGGFDFR